MIFKGDNFLKVITYRPAELLNVRTSHLGKQI
jgi:hypothetical protein